MSNNWQNSLNLDFNQLTNYYPFSEKYITKLKLVFGVGERDGISTVSGIKRKLQELKATGQYTTIAELAKVTGYSDSYISRILKHKK